MHQCSDLFSGIAVPEQALKRLGTKHNLVFACDINDFCKKTYFAHYNIKEEQWYKDIHTIKGEEYVAGNDFLRKCLIFTCLS